VQKSRTRTPLRSSIANDKELIPGLVEVQVNSFNNFVTEGIKNELLSISPIVSSNKKMTFEFLGTYEFNEPQKTYFECKDHETTYSAPLRADVRLINHETGEVQEQRVFMGDIPIITEYGTFLINGAERVVVSQFVRSPGVYYRKKVTNTSVQFFSYVSTIVTNRGSWLEFELDYKKNLMVCVNKTRRIPMLVFLNALGFSTNDVLEKTKNHHLIEYNIANGDPELAEEEALIEVYRRLRPGDPVTLDGARVMINGLFFDESKYDLGDVGRYKINSRFGTTTDSMVLTHEDIWNVINELLVLVDKGEGFDDIDHLGSRRVRAVGDQLQKQFRVGLVRLERLIREQMVLKGEGLTPQKLINVRPLVAIMREFFGTSQMSQFMDQINPLAEIAHRRRLSALGPGGLSKDRAGFDVRDIHPSHYGRICPIETPEGPNAGLIGPLSTYARLNQYGFIETPYYQVKNAKISDTVEYLSADQEDKFNVAPWDTPSEKGVLTGESCVVRKNRNIAYVNVNEVHYIGVSPKQLVSVSCGLIPFLEHNDANRALMGANMQRQAVPLMFTESPYVGTGMEKVVARDAGSGVIAKADGVVSYASADTIVVKGKSKSETYPLRKYQRSNQDTCKNQKPIVRIGDSVKSGDMIADGPSSCNAELSLGRNVCVAFLTWDGYNFEDAIVVSERLVKDDVFTSVHIHKYEVDVRSTKLGPEEITRDIPNVSDSALRYLDEDGIVRVGSVVKAGDILVGKITPKGETEPPAEEKLLRAIFGEKARDVRDSSLRVSSGEYGKVVGVKVFSKDDASNLSPGVNMVVRIYIAQSRKVSIGDKMAGRHGNKGVVSIVLPEEDMPFLPNGQPVDVILNPLGVPSRMNVGQLFETMLGLSAHFLEEAYEAQQFDEVAGKDESVEQVEKRLELASKQPGCDWINTTGKIELRDGRTGMPLERPVTVGYMYMLKLIHLVEDKIHARSTGPYSLVTQQPLGGKAQYGGQRFGEMEVWALEAYGAAYTLQEILTLKSDDLVGRTEAYRCLIQGLPMIEPGAPESFCVLMKEMRSLGLDVRIVGKSEDEIDTR